jgi:hypothetical protein
MQRPAQKNPALGAKRRAEIRPYYGMPPGLPASRTPALGALAGLGVIWAISGCFNPNYGNCRLTCDNDKDCPGNLTCVKEDVTGRGFCATTETCPAPKTDAGADAGAMDAGGDDGTDAMDGGDGGDGPDGETLGPPGEICHNGNCFTLPPAVRANLVLLLWPSNLPTVGSPVDIWLDQSGQGNDATAAYPSAPPHVIANGVHLDASQRGSGFEVRNSPTLDFGSGDFVVIVVAGLSSSTKPVSFFRKSDGARDPSHQISIDWVLAPPTGRPQGTVNDTLAETTAEIAQPSVGVYTLQRATDRIELHLNGTVLGSANLPAGASTSNAANVFVGVTGIVGSPADSIAAVIAIREAIDASHLAQLEAFLRMLFMMP